jgi:hypothetical protein
VSWPTIADLARALGVQSAASAELDAELARALGAAIEAVCTDCGYTGVVVTDPATTPAAVGFSADPDPVADPPEEPAEIVPNYRLEQAALILGVTTMKSPDAPFGVAAVFDAGGLYVARANPNYTRLLVGNRIRFGVG